MNSTSESWELFESQIKDAEKFFKGGDLRNALINIWQGFETGINIVKESKNNIPVYSHQDKLFWIEKFYRDKILTNDYSEVFKELIELRLTAQFGPYARIPKTYSRQDVKRFFRKLKEFKSEVEETRLKRITLKTITNNNQKQ